MATRALDSTLYQRFLDDDRKGVRLSASDLHLAQNEVNRIKRREQTQGKLGRDLATKLANLERILAKYDFGRGTPLPTSNPFTLGTGGATGRNEPILTRSQTATPPPSTTNSDPPPLFTAPPDRTGLPTVPTPTAEPAVLGPMETPFTQPLGTENEDGEVYDDEWISNDDEQQTETIPTPTILPAQVAETQNRNNNLNPQTDFIIREMDAENPLAQAAAAATAATAPVRRNLNSYDYKYKDGTDNLTRTFGSVPALWQTALKNATPKARPKIAERKFAKYEDPNEIKRTAFNANNAYKHVGYTDSMNEVGKRLGLAEGEDLSKILPQRLLDKNIKNVYTVDRRFYDPDEYVEAVEEPTEAEYALAELLKQGNRPYNDQIVGKTRRNMAGNVLPLSQSQKSTARNQATIQRANTKAAFQQTLDQSTLQKALAASQKIRAYNRYKKHDRQKQKTYWDPDQGDWVNPDDDYLREQTALRNIRNKLPASITRPEYMGWLSDKKVEGLTIDDPTLSKAIKDDGGYGAIIKAEEDNIQGLTWQTLDPEVRNKYMAMFAELIGILNTHPVYDERLVAPNSAAYVFPKDDFEINMVNLDRNRLTPAVCVISTKIPIKYHGVNLPAGSIVSVGGWSLANATEGYSTNQLKDILYYNANPTKDLRRANPRTLWLNKLFGDPATKKDNTKSLKFIVDHLRLVFEGQGVQFPHLWQDPTNPSKAVNIPVFMKFIAANRVVAYLSMSTPVFRTFLTRVAELFFNVYIAPLAIATLEGTTQILRDLARVLSGLENPYTLKLNADGTVDYEEKPNGAAPGQKDYRFYDDLTALSNLDGVAFRSCCNWDWHQTYYHSDFLGALFRDSVFKQFYARAVQAIFDEAGPNKLPKGVAHMMHTIMFWTMHSDLPSMVDNIYHKETGFDESNKAHYIDYVNTIAPRIEFCTPGDIDKIVNKPNQVITVTNKNWRQEVIPRYKVTQRGFTYVISGIGHDNYYPLAWADKKYFNQVTAAAPPPE